MKPRAEIARLTKPRRSRGTTVKNEECSKKKRRENWGGQPTEDEKGERDHVDGRGQSKAEEEEEDGYHNIKHDVSDVRHTLRGGASDAQVSGRGGGGEVNGSGMVLWKGQRIHERAEQQGDE